MLNVGVDEISVRKTFEQKTNVDCGGTGYAGGGR